MNLAALLPQFKGNAETLLLTSALHYATAGKVDVAHMDADAAAIGICTLLGQLEAEHPGIAERYGWARIADLQAFGAAIGNASQATKPSGLL